ncbi:hypothetical protein [Clostridium tagluense]|uniref:B30.2/SPRY domain-containing protein n=1 Tax=Clostridium tagluense TaxID=360422 RepID=A0A401UQE5_9CLOT|nr:hypothetical protein [Clostridium tagluense]GCD11783.1 hypothetical protein Ctaglu_34060 [Clostridium tagluense]
MSITYDGSSLVQSTLSSDKLTLTATASYGCGKLNKSYLTGKYYLEFKILQNIQNGNIGIIENTKTYTSGGGLQSSGDGYYCVADIGGWIANDICSMWLDIDKKEMKIYKNNVLITSYYGTYAKSIINPIPSISIWGGVSCQTILKPPFKYTIPVGYKPYDYEIIKYLVQQNNDIYAMKSEFHVNLGQPTNDTQLQEWFKMYGSDDLSCLMTEYDKNTAIVKDMGVLGSGKLFSYDIKI